MRQVYALIFCILCSMPFLQAQVTMTYSSHGFKDGDKHISQEVEYKEPGLSGKGLIWDFSDLILSGAPDTSFIYTSENNGYNMEASMSNDNTYTLYNVTEQANEYKGYKIGDLTIYYDKPMVKTQYPQTYGSSFEGNFEGTVNHNERVIGNVSGTYSTQGDAMGTILLPGNINLPVLRVKTMERFSNAPCGCKNEVVEVEKYLWYAQDVRYPVFVSISRTITSLTDNTSKTIQRSYFNTGIELPQIKSTLSPLDNIAYSVSPNPFMNNIQISYTLPQEMKVNIDLYNAQGIKLASILPLQMQKGEQVITSYIAPYTQKEGVYFVKLQFGDKVYSEKIVRANP